MNLTEAKEGEEYIIKEILTDDEELTSFLFSIWPKRPGSWNYGAKKAREAFKRVAWAIAESEEVFMLAEPDVEENAREMLAGNPGHGIHVIRMESDDAWAPRRPPSPPAT